MLEFYKTFGTETKKIDKPEPGSWISAIAPTEEEKNYLIEEMGILPEFVKSSLDAEESSHIDYDEDYNQTLVIVDYPSAEEVEDGYDKNMLQYTTLPLGIVIMKGYVVTISLYENLNIDDMAQGRIKGVNTDLKTRFLLLLLLRISQRYLIYLRQIDRISSRTEQRLHKSMQNKELIQMLGLEKSLVYFSTSLKTDEITLNKIMRGKAIKLYDQDLLDDVLIEIHQAIEMYNIYSNILSGTMDAFASVISNNLNIVMKVLTVITIVMAIPNIIFSFYGMNVAGLPFPQWWFPTGLAIVACIIATIIFIKKDMFH